MKKIALLFILISTLSLSISANDGGYSYGSAGTLIPIKVDNISMIEEEINITVDKIAEGSYLVKYNCAFLFKNNTDKPQNVLMGFPINYGSNFSTHDIKYGQNDTFDFKVYIEDKEVKSEKYFHGINPELNEIKGYDEVYGFYVNFKPNETKKVINNYSMLIFQGMLERPSINYVLKSGLTWRQPIKKADIKIKFNSYVTLNKAPINKMNYQISYDPYLNISYHYENFSPDNDIIISFENKYDFPDYFVHLAHSNSNSIHNLHSDYYEYLQNYISYFNSLSKEKKKELSYYILEHNRYYGDDEFKDYIREKNYDYITDENFKIADLPYEEKVLYDYLVSDESADLIYEHNIILKELIGKLEKERSIYNLYKLSVYLRNAEGKESYKKSIDKQLLDRAYLLLNDTFDNYINDKSINIKIIKQIYDYINNSVKIYIKKESLERAGAIIDEYKKNKDEELKGKLLFLSENINEYLNNDSMIKTMLIYNSYLYNLSYDDNYKSLFTKQDFDNVKEKFKNYFSYIIIDLLENDNSIYTYTISTLENYLAFTFDFRRFYIDYLTNLNLNIKKNDERSIKKIERFLNFIENFSPSLFEQVYIHTDILKKTDLLINLYYFLGTYYFDKEILKSLESFKKTLFFSLPIQYRNFVEKTELKDLAELDFNKFSVKEGDQSPIYYICYNIACINSIQNNIDEAILWFELALFFGYPDYNWLNKDEDIKNLRSDKRFNEIITIYKKRLNESDKKELEIKLKQKIIKADNIDLNRKIKNYINLGKTNEAMNLIDLQTEIDPIYLNIAINNKNFELVKHQFNNEAHNL